MAAAHPDPSRILQIGSGFWASKTLLSAVELEVFTHLAQGQRSGAELGAKLGLHPRAIDDFFDSLVALGFLQREGSGPSSVYSNTPDSAVFLDKKSPAYLGGILEMFNTRLYRFWGDLTEALRTGKPQNEMKERGHDKMMFAELYADPRRLEQFMDAMGGIQMGNFLALAEKFDFARHRSVCDVGGAKGVLAICVARRHPQVKCTTFDLPPVEPIARRTIQAAGLANRIEVVSGDFMTDELPKADIITMGNILHDWGLETKRQLIAKAYKALPEGGAFIAIENIIDDERRKNAFGLLMSLNMLIETGEGFDYTGAQFDAWCKEAGFKSTEIVPLAGPTSAAIARK